MHMKFRITVIVLVLGVILAGESVVLPAQTPSESTTQKNQLSNDTSSGKIDPKTQSVNESTKREAITGNSKNLIGIGTLMLGIAAVLGILLKLAQFIYKVKSKVDLPYSSEDIDKQDLAEKLDKIQQTVEQNPKASLIEKAIADAYMLQRGDRIEDALEKWSSIANITEGNNNDLASRALVSVGYLCIKEGTGKQALSTLNKAIYLKPDYVEAYNNRGAAKNLLGKHKDALADYNTAIRLKSDYVEAYNNRGTVKCLLSRYQDAIADFDEAIRLKSDYAEAHDSRGSAKHLLGRSQDAIADYNEAIRLKPDNVQTYYHRGQTYETLEKYEEALVDYDQVIVLNPDYSNAYIHRGSVYFRLGYYREAIIDYRKAIQLIKSDKITLDSNQENSILLTLKKSDFGEAEIHNNLGIAKFRLGECDEALADYDKAIQLKPDFVEAYKNRGAAKIQLKRTHEAFADFDEVIRLKPDDAEAYNNRGGTKIYLNQPGEALIDFNEAIRIKPNYAEAYANRAEAKTRLGTIDESRLDFKIALELAEQQGLTDFKVQIEKRLQELSNSTSQTDET